MRVCKLYRVSGRVQGVYFRAATQTTAVGLGLTGWVRNCDNGDVEVLACGYAPQVDALAQWLWQGPPRAQVDAVQELPCQAEERETFDVRYD
jgi:acylphosphatase